MSDDRLRNKLNRFGAMIGGGQSPAGRNLPNRYNKLARSVGAEIRTNDSGAYCLARTLYPFNYIHGQTILDTAVGGATVPLAAYTAQELPGEVSVDSLLFIDTETTGLGGAGTVAFLVGCGSVVDGGFEVRQYLLPDYSDEASMLTDLLEEFSEHKSLVSYNGATFDLPVLRDRMVINRVSKDLDHAHHIDLLHSARRLFKRRLQDCRLTNIEAELFGFTRTDDIPGFLIPSAYFEWLGEENVEIMPSILEHNRLDIITLYFLLGHIGRIFESQGEVLAEVDDLHSLSRLYGRRKKADLVGQVFSRIDELSDKSLAADIRFYHAMNFKRMNQLARAVEMWQSLADSNSREGYWSNVELAKHFEHRENDPAQALAYARRAKAICPYGESQQRLLQKRLGRLALKIKG